MNPELPFIKKRLFSPGPTPVPLPSLLATVEQTAYHRTQDFYSLFLSCRERLSPLFGTSTPPLILTASGTGAMEAAVVNLTEPGDEVLCLVGGKFGERWLDINRAYGCQVDEVAFPWGQGPDLTSLEKVLLGSSRLKAVFLQANETSTGVALPVQEISQLIKRCSSALVVVDAISSLGAQRMAMDAWQVDAVVSCSQKGFGTPPGLAFIALGALGQARLSSRPRFYFDFKRELSGQAEGRSAFTPATSLIACLDRSLQMIHEVGLERMLHYHKAVASGVREAMSTLGFRLLGEGFPSQAVTAGYLPEGIAFAALNELLRERYAQTFAGGQDQFKGKILRFAHLGLFDYLDIASGVVALEEALIRLGARHRPGDAVGRFMSAVAQSGL